MKLPINITVVAGISLYGSRTVIDNQTALTIREIHKAMAHLDLNTTDAQIEVKASIVPGYKPDHKHNRDPDVVHHITIWVDEENYSDLIKELSQRLESED